jgi:alcohol dehydrogenase (cytochrome c)
MPTIALVWTWAMNNGTNQAAPVVHNGVMFINNPGNIVQALDARTGELIWENRIGDSDAGSSQRGLAMFEDKIYITTGEAHIYSLDARTGKNVWDTAIGDRTKYSYSTSSGPIIAKGKVIQGLGGSGCCSRPNRTSWRSRYRPPPGWPSSSLMPTWPA